ncbi:MAG: 16S rRNA (guanine(966)-N(2))-methyltransferase RsmD [Planctomycetota bacterium]|jgi:16S rRNA (guanine(966)-N(2))-methyltransferase RsmD
MRIIAGEKRGMKLLSPKTTDSRPIIDRVKESLFSVLYKYDIPAGKIVADVFSGVGSLGLESLSRGAKFVTFVEKDAKVVEVLNKNIARAGYVGKSKVVRANAFKVGAPVNFEGPRYDLVFVDPPYVMSRQSGEGSMLYGLLSLLPEQVAEEGLVVVRTEKRSNLLENYGQLRIIDRRVWSEMAVTILQVTG